MTWHYLAMTMLLASAAAGISYSFYPAASAKPVADQLGRRVFSAPDLPSLLGHAQVNTYSQLPAPIITATASARPPVGKHRRKPAAPHPAIPAASPTAPAPSAASPSDGGATPLGGASYAGSLMLNETGAQLASWNQTSSFCTGNSWESPSGTVSTNSSGDVMLSTTGTPGSCVALISPQAYSSAVIQAEIDFPALPGKPGTIADWTSFWLTNSANWPNDGELDAVEAEPVDGINAVAWHSGSNGSEFTASTDGFFSTTLPKDGPNLTPGWHTVDIVYTRGFFAVYYDGKEFTSYTSGNVTGDPLNIYITTSVTPDISSIQQQLGGPPVNSDSSPATYAVKYLKVWSFK
jgi:hypothetical protein